MKSAISFARNGCSDGYIHNSMNKILQKHNIYQKLKCIWEKLFNHAVNLVLLIMKQIFSWHGHTSLIKMGTGNRQKNMRKKRWPLRRNQLLLFSKLIFAISLRV